MMCVAEQGIDVNAGAAQYGTAERWISTRLGHATERVIQGIADYRFDLAAQALYEFTWDEYCDWYVELSKTTLTDPESSEAQKRGVLQTLLTNLELLLRLLHPFIPFITEELWQKVAPLLNRHGETIMLQPYPSTEEIARIVSKEFTFPVDWQEVVRSNADALAEMEWLKSFVLGIRRIRAERDIAPRKPLDIKVKGGSEQEQAWLQANSSQIQVLTSVNDIARVDVEPDDAVTAQAGSMTQMVPLADLIDPGAETDKLNKELARFNADRDRLSGKLQNRNFIDKAPPEIVQKERDKLADMDASANRLAEQLERISKLIK